MLAPTTFKPLSTNVWRLQTTITRWTSDRVICMGNGKCSRILQTAHILFTDEIRKDQPGRKPPLKYKTMIIQTEHRWNVEKIGKTEYTATLVDEKRVVYRFTPGMGMAMIGCTVWIDNDVWTGIRTDGNIAGKSAREVVLLQAQLSRDAGDAFHEYMTKIEKR